MKNILSGKMVQSLLITLGVVMVFSVSPALQQTLAQDRDFYVVRRGDTLFKIARMHALTVTAVREMNHLKSNTIRIGQRLRIRPESSVTGWTRPSGEKQDAARDEKPPSVRSPPSDSRRSDRPDSALVPDHADSDDVNALSVDIGIESPIDPTSADAVLHVAVVPGTAVYLAEEGDTFFSLAARMSIPVDSLERMNPDAPSFLAAGTELLVPEEKMARAYRVKRGDTLFGIANRFSVRAAAIRSLNEMRNSNLRAGQKLMIPGQGMRPGEDEESLKPEILEKGTAITYPETFTGRLVAGGGIYDPDRFTISHPELPFGSVVLLTATTTGKETFAVVTDRGFTGEPVIIDISRAVGDALSILHKDHVTVELRVVTDPLDDK